MLITQSYEPEFISTIFGTIVERPPRVLVANSHATLKFTFKVGRYGIDDGGHIIIAWPVTSSFGTPQFTDKSGDNYTEMVASGNVKLSYEFKNSAYIRPHMPCITVKVWDGALKEGDTFSFIMGSQDHGSRGIGIQTYVENNIAFKLALDPFGTNLYTELPDQALVDVIAGDADHLHIKTKSQVVAGRPFWIALRAEDLIGNTSAFTGKLRVSCAEIDFSLEIELLPEHNGWLRIEDAVITTPGIYRLHLSTDDGQMTASSNPIEIIEEEPELQLFWGDLHGQTGETVGSGTITEYLEFGRDIAAVDFISHAANAFQVTNDIWKSTQDNIKNFHMPHSYVTFLGYEWSGVTSAGGDHNVYYLNDDMPIHRCSHALIHDKSDLDTDRYPVSELYKEFQGREDVMIIPHIGGRRATLDVFDEGLTPFIEIVSVHGHFQWFADEAMERGLKTGFICSSDTHSGRPGDTFPVTYIEAVPTGLTAAYAEELTRESLWQAFKQRHVYGTTGARIIVQFSANDAMMGDEITATDLNFRVKVIGTSAVEKVEILRNNDVVYQHPLLQNKTKVLNKITLRWSGARTQYRRRNSNWSGEISIDNGVFEEVTPVAFDLPWEGITHQDKSVIKFISTTAGDYDIIEISYKGNPSTSITFKSDILTHTFKPCEITEIVTLDGGLVEQRLEIVPHYSENYPESIEFTHDLSKNASGAYYLRVLQSDGEKAWSSPIFVK